MDKNAIKRYAVWARRELISRVSQKALQYGITEENIVPADVATVNGVVLSNEEKKQRRALIDKINDKGYPQVMEEVAYTWFNRFIALRFMEVNGYLPSHVRVFTDDENNFKPQILAEAINLDFDGLDMDKVYELKDANDNEVLFKYLLIVQCNALNPIMPRMFQKISDYTELLFPDNLLREGSVVQQMVELIPEEDWKDAVQLLGWLYQYYISDKHDEIINIYKGAVKKEDIPAATQLFTTDWVVRYMVDNSLGRYWVERHPESTLTEKLQFLVIPPNGQIQYIEEDITPQELTFFDPCMGSGHILLYAFDVLMEIYRECGYSDREAASEIIQHNIFGLDIDDRCSQLAYFSVMMKARSYDRRFFAKGLKPNVLSIKESNKLLKFTHDTFMPDKDMNHIGEYLIELFRDAKEIGSLVVAKSYDYDSFQKYLSSRADDEHLDIELAMWQLQEMPLMKDLAEQAKILANKYTVVCTNPPYLGKMEGKLKNYVINNFKLYSSDLFSVFVYHNFDFCKKMGYSAYMTPFVWMFIKAYENLREYIVSNKHIVSLVQLEYSAFEEATVPICSFILQNEVSKGKGTYIKLSSFKGGMEVQRKKVLEALDDVNSEYFYETLQKNYIDVPGMPIAFWIGEKVFEAFRTFNKVGQFYEVRNGITTGDNNKFLRLWFETSSVSKKWFPCNKGGAYRKWAGNRDYCVDWENQGYNLKNFTDEKGKQRSTLRGIDLNFTAGITMSRITSGSPSFREMYDDSISESATNAIYPKSGERKHMLTLLGLLNSKVGIYILDLLNPTINVVPEDIRSVPIYSCTDEYIEKKVEENIEISIEDWNYKETSWDFKRNPLVRNSAYIADAYAKWEEECENRFDRLRNNEIKINEHFIEIFGLNGSIKAEVADEEVTVRKADKARDIKEFISYAVGCMLGRYSLSKEGIIYAGGEWNEKVYGAYAADKDGIIPICDDDYFDDDIVNRFVHFVEVIYGEETLEKNLEFISAALGGKGSPKEVIRNYFLYEFFNDHCSMYSVASSGKRPIYWLFDSGKKNGFKALVYMHRYQPDTIARMRTDYVHEQQSRYRTAIADLGQRIASASTSERVKLNKELKTLKDQAAEIQVYEEKIHHLADQYISIDLDDGVKANYAKFQDVLAKIK